jgi:hypothetical protein
MSTYDQIMAYYADDEEFQKRAQTRWKYFEREGYRKLSDILPVDDYADKVEKYALYYYLAKETRTPYAITPALTKAIKDNVDNPEIDWNAIYEYLDERKQEATTLGCNLHEEVVDALEIIETYRDKLTGNNFVLY